MKNSKKYDVVVLTDRRYLLAKANDSYSENVVLEDKLVVEALQAIGLKTIRLPWDEETFDWASTHVALFRTTWDYFDHFDRFKIWFNETASKTSFLNNKSLIEWNLDKRYLLDLEAKGIAIPPTKYIEKGSAVSLQATIESTSWQTIILKPAISGAGRHTYKFKREEFGSLENLFEQLLKQESLMVQEFQENIEVKGEISVIIINNKFTHAVLKKAKTGDFRVQDDFGGSVYNYVATEDEIQFALQAIAACPSMPMYARVDLMWDNVGNLCLGELEMIEPELWFRLNPSAATTLALGIKNYLTL